MKWVEKTFRNAGSEGFHLDIQIGHSHAQFYLPPHATFTVKIPDGQSVVFSAGHGTNGSHKSFVLEEVKPKSKDSIAA